MRGDSQVEGELFQHLRATALTFASVTTGVALALGVSHTLQIKDNGVEYYYVLNFFSFVLLARLWWRYVSLVSYYAPSSNLDQYCVDFAIAAVGIAAVFFFSQPDLWAFCYAVVYLLLVVKDVQVAAALDQVAYGRRKSYNAYRTQLRRKIPTRHLLRVAIFGGMWLACHVTGNNKTCVLLCVGVILVIFLILIWNKPYDLAVPKRGLPLALTAIPQDRIHAESRRAKQRGSVKKKKRK